MIVRRKTFLNPEYYVFMHELCFLVAVKANFSSKLGCK